MGRGIDLPSSVILNLPGRLPELVSTAALTKEAFSSFAMPNSVAQMERFANQHREVHAAMERAALPYREIADQVSAMSRYFDSTHAALGTLNYDKNGELISASDVTRDLVTRTTIVLEHRNAALIASLNFREGRLASAPPFVSELPTLDMFVHSRTIRSITPHAPSEPAAEQESASLRVDIVEETTAFLELTLPQLKPSFLTQYRGRRDRRVC